jgi:Uri superfamily endonuclease
MKPPDLRSEIELEKANLKQVLADVARTQVEIASPAHSPTIVAGAAAYIAQCYGGIELILKRIVRHRNLELPSGGEWHIELLKIFRRDSGNSHAFISEELFSKLSLMRKFRHFVIHGYGFSLDAATVTAALSDTPGIVAEFLDALDGYLECSGKV